MKLVKDPHGYYRCDPIPSKEELDKLYKDEFYTEAKPRYIERQEEDIAWWETMYGDRLGILEEIAENKPSPPILDVGCGAGFFLYRAYRYGWWILGVEPNDEARRYAQELCFHGKFVSSLDEVQEQFSAIHISEVLEHIPDPLEMLQNCHDRLFDGGAICVVVPNEKFDSKGNLVYPHVFQPPQHINYFGFNSIENLMRKAGFEIYERSAMYPMEFFLEQGFNHIGNDAVGRLCHTMRMNFDLSMTSAQRRKLYRELAKEGYGREAVIYGVKHETH